VVFIVSVIGYFRHGGGVLDNCSRMIMNSFPLLLLV